MDPQTVERKLAAILSADVVGYSRLMAQDEAATIRTITAYRAQITQLVSEHRGRIVDTAGDGVLAEFPAALDAVECAVGVQRVVNARNLSLPEPRRMRYRVGVHLGDVSQQEGRLYGDGVNIAARLEGLAEPGGICVSGEIHGQVASKIDLDFVDLGERSVKNIPKPVRVYRVDLNRTPVRSRIPLRGRFARAKTTTVVAAVVVGTLAGFLIWILRESRLSIIEAPARFALEVLGDGRLADRSFPPIALAPDGGTITYVAASGNTTQLFVRPLDRFESTAVPGTDGAVSPFFSPDGDWVAYFAKGALRKVPTAGGVPAVVCELANVDRPSAYWGRDGEITFSRGVNSSDGLMRVSANGGVPERITSPDVEAGESWHGLPQVLPGGDVLFTVAAADGFRAAILSSESGEWEVLDWLGPAAAARYLPSGHLVFGQPARLMALPWRVGDRTGTPVPVLDGVYTSRLGLPYFGASESGSLLYVPGPAVRTAPILVDREGNPTVLTDAPGAFQHPRFSPDGTHLAVDVTWQGRSDIYVYDLERGSRRRLTHRGFNIDPLWTPDGNRIFFRSNRSTSGAQDVYWIPADGSGEAERLPVSAPDMVPGSWAGDGRLLVLTDISSARQTRDLWILDTTSGGAPEQLLSSPHNVGWGAFSPDGRWLAYASDESGEDEVWVRPFGRTGPAEQVSTGGGIEPLWSPEGGELFYRRGDEFLAVVVETEPRLRPGTTRTLFRGRYDLSPTGHQHYDIHPDGRHFAVIDLGENADPKEIRLILAWGEELARRLPAPHGIRMRVEW